MYQETKHQKPNEPEESLSEMSPEPAPEAQLLTLKIYILNVHLELFVPCSCVGVLGNNASLSGVCLTSSMLENSSDSSSSSRVLIPTGLLFQIKIL